MFVWGYANLIKAKQNKLRRPNQNQYNIKWWN
jgi:hypothetical protein